MSTAVRAADDPAASSRLSTLCALAVRSSGIDGASVILVSMAGHRSLLASTDARSEQLESLLATCREGPGIDAVSGGHPVLASDLENADTGARWPVFTGEALTLGVGALFAAPLRIGVISVGVFVGYRRAPGELSNVELAHLLRICDAAALGVLDLAVPADDRPAHSDERPDALAVDGTSDALGNFVSAEVHQASGMVMAQLGVPIEAALSRLRAHAYMQHRPLIDIAREVIARRLELER